MSLENHTTYYRVPTGSSKLILGEKSNSIGVSGSVPRSKVLITNKNPQTSCHENTVRIHRLNSSFQIEEVTVWSQMQSFCDAYNSGYSGKMNSSVIHSPCYREGYDYIFNIFTGEFGDSEIRFVWCPEEPESWMIGTGVNVGDKSIYFPNIDRSILKKHFWNAQREQEDTDEYYSWSSGSGYELNLTLGINNDENVTVTGISGDHFLLKNTTSKAHPLATRMVSTNTLHAPPSGETGFVQDFTVRIADNNDGDSRFYIAGSGVTGGCHLGGTFTGSGYTFFETPIIDVYRGFDYFFNQHHASNSDEYIMFSYTSGGHNNGGAAITGKYEVTQGGSNYCFNNYCHYHCPDEQTFMIPIDSPDKIYYYASGTSHVGGTGYLNVLTSGDGGN